MTVSSQVSDVSYAGDGTTTNFAVPFYFLQDADLSISVISADGAPQAYVLGTDYTVTGAGLQAGGSITTIGTPVPTGKMLYIERNPPVTQETAYQANDPFPAAAHEKALDKLTMLVQRLARTYIGSLHFPLTDTTDGTLPKKSSRAGRMLGFDELGQPTLLPIPTSVGAGDMRVDTFTDGVDFDAGVTTQLTLSLEPGSPDNLEIFFDPLYQGPDQWSLLGAVVTFTSPIPVGVSKVFARIGSTLSVTIPPDASVTDVKVAPGANIDLEKIVYGKKLSRVVTSITALRALDKTKHDFAFVTGYYASGDGGGGQYYRDAADTLSADNGGTIIVATDGARWKRNFHESLSVRVFGAKGDGVTDDQPAIQACVNVFTTNGGEVYFPDGEYAIGGTGITIPNAVADFSGLQLRGSGQGTQLKKIGTTNSLISILGGRATVRDMTLNGNNLAGSGIFNNTASNGYGTRVFNVGFVSMTDQGFFNNNGGTHMIHDCYFLNAGQWAIKSVNDMQNTAIYANLIQGSGGIQVDNTTFQCEGLRISDNTIFATGGSGIHIEIVHGLEIYIHNNILDQGIAKCIRLRNNTSLVKITSNWISPSNSDEGVAIGDDVNSCTIQGNTFNGGLIQCSVGASSLGRVHSIQVLDNQFKTDGSTTPIQFANITRSMVRGNITDDASNSFVEAGGSNIISAFNIFKVNQSVSGGVTTTGNIIA